LGLAFLKKNETYQKQQTKKFTHN